MRSKLIIFITIALCLSINSCTTKDGIWEDNILLSTKEVAFEANADSVEITTEGEGWWLSNIRFDDEQIDFSDIITTNSTFEIIEDEFSVTRISSKNLQVIMTENQSENPRELRIGVQAGNYFDGITIIQQGQ